LPADISPELMRLLNAEFEKAGAHAAVKAFWRPQMTRFALWFAAT
jgi:hypothetical protein